MVSTADRAMKAAGSGSESNQVFTGLYSLESSDSVELCGLDCTYIVSRQSPKGYSERISALKIELLCVRTCKSAVIDSIAVKEHQVTQLDVE